MLKKDRFIKPAILFLAKKRTPSSFSPAIERLYLSIADVSEKQSDFSLFPHIAVPKKRFVFVGYLIEVFRIRKQIRKLSVEIIHVHFSLMACIVFLATRKPVVVSLLGTDVFSQKWYYRWALKWVNKRADHIIVKSDSMLAHVRKHAVSVIPNGVNMNTFKTMNKIACRNTLGWAHDKMYILFPGPANRPWKNVTLAKNAISKLANEQSKLQFIILDNAPKETIPTYLNAADVVLLTSKWEGSSNITKEAMACNTVMVSTKVGDTEHLFEGTEGYFLADQDSDAIAEKLKEAMIFINNKNEASGRSRLFDLKLDAESSAVKIIACYTSILNKRNPSN